MKRDTLLLILTMAGSALCWWPAAIEPSVDFPRWILLVIIALLTGLATILSDQDWLRFVAASVVGVLAGLWSGSILFPPSNPLARAYAGLAFFLIVPPASFVALFAGFVGQKWSVSSKKHRRAIWVALLCCVAFGPILLALTPPLVAHRVAHNDRAAVARFSSLKSAVERSLTETGDPERICNGQSLKRHYSGPPFSDEDWNRITGNYVKQDGYFFMVYCHKEKGGYKIDAHPARGKVDGTRRFCTDKAGQIGCGMEWTHACIPCTK